MTWASFYPRGLREVAVGGNRVNLRAGRARELEHANFRVKPEGFQRLEGRGGSEDFARLEQLCYLAGEPPHVLGVLSQRYRELCHRPMAGRYGWPDAYGPRLRSQWNFVLRELAERPNSLRAMAMVWHATDIWKVAQDTEQTWPVPCTVALHFYVRRGEVCVHAFMRSCDIWLGLYYDVPAFAFLGRCVAFALGRPFRELCFTATSLHLYEKDWPNVERVTARVLSTVNPLTQWGAEHELDPEGSMALGEPRQPIGPAEARTRFRGLQEYAKADIRRWQEEHPE